MGCTLKTFTGCVLVCLAIALTVVALATPSWEQNDAHGMQTTLGLWTTCEKYDDGTNVVVCSNFGIDKVDAAVRFCRFTCIINFVVGIASLVIFFVNRTQHKWDRGAYVSTFLIMACGVLMFCATTWYALKYRGAEIEDRLRFGYSLILAWLSIPFYIVGGVLLLLGLRSSKGNTYEDRDRNDFV